MPLSIADIIGILGFMLAAVLAVREIQKDRRRICVECELVATPSSINSGMEYIQITATNTGHPHHGGIMRPRRSQLHDPFNEASTDRYAAQEANGQRKRLRLIRLF